jgi:hypothetical protein
MTKITLSPDKIGLSIGKVILSSVDNTLSIGKVILSTEKGKK